MKQVLRNSNPTNFTLSTMVGFIPQEEEPETNQKKKKGKGKVDEDTLNWRRQQFEVASENYQKYVPVLPLDPNMPIDAP